MTSKFITIINGTYETAGKIAAAVAAGFTISVEVAMCGDTDSLAEMKFCKTIEDAREAYKSMKNLGNLAMVYNHEKSITIWSGFVK